MQKIEPEPSVRLWYCSRNERNIKVKIAIFCMFARWERRPDSGKYSPWFSDSWAQERKRLFVQNCVLRERAKFNAKRELISSFIDFEKTFPLRSERSLIDAKIRALRHANLPSRRKRVLSERDYRHVFAWTIKLSPRLGPDTLNLSRWFSIFIRHRECHENRNSTCLTSISLSRFGFCSKSTFPNQI